VLCAFGRNTGQSRFFNNDHTIQQRQFCDCFGSSVGKRKINHGLRPKYVLDVTPCGIIYVVIFRTNSPAETYMWKKSSIKPYIISHWEKRTIWWELDLFSSLGKMVGRHVDSWVEQKEIFLITLGRAGE
jgi:hypothetical protein